MSGCHAPDYVTDDVNVAEILPMSQPDTNMKLSKICNNVIMGSGSLNQQLIPYVSTIVESNYDDKESILNTIDMNIETVKNANIEISSFNPANALKSKTDAIKKELNNTEKILQNLKKDVKEDKANDITNSLKEYMNSIAQLKTYSTGV